MELHRIYGEFDTEELAELAAGRIRRAVRGIRRMTICRLSPSRQPVGGRMTNYATDVLYSEISTRAVPEPKLRQDAELMILCGDAACRRVESLLHAAGAMRVRVV